MKRVLLIGFYGCGNLGDDAMLYALLSQAEGKKYHITVSLGKESLHGFTLPCGVKSVYRKGIGLMIALLRSRYVVFGGGSLLQNRTGQASLCYYLSLILLSRLLRKRVYLVSSGLGPINGRFSVWLCGKILPLCSGITMRDRRAIALAESFGVKNAEYTPRGSWA